MAQVLKDCKLIVWDECTMAHKSGFEALSRTLKDIRENNSLMGGVTVLLAGDFRHISGNLHSNTKVHLSGNTSAGVFPEVLLKIGDGNYPSLEGKIIIPSDLGTVVTSLSELTSKIYPDISNIKKMPTEWLCEHAILILRNDKAAAINDILLKAFEAQDLEYRSFDSVIQTDDTVHYPTKFLNTLNPPGLPSHKLILKVAASVIILRNLNPP
ncbi:uncharacterized protein LOC111637003 [Centruroides sculpturatus]|uniref:uncharacterized protein LOC111637003 n=1 Tax=Centruroides sculpturatus TaxID=218467 RepID=UPI000C6CB9D4|nr:uncharacterized protein LOC111637003 [Centruroides sculpturatus]